MTRQVVKEDTWPSEPPWPVDTFWRIPPRLDPFCIIPPRP